jgi:antitoxin YobK
MTKSKNDIIVHINDFGIKIHKFTKVDYGQINNIEKDLMVSLPNSYKWFLSEYGLLIMPGYIILGTGLDKTAACVKSTLDWREYGLPQEFVVIEDGGNDWIFCLDTSQMVEGECPVVDWWQGDGVGKESFPTFFDFLEVVLCHSEEIKK